MNETACMFPLSRLMVCLVVAAALTGADSVETDPGQPGGHRAFQPLSRPAPPPVHGSPRTAVDRFILAAIEARGLTLSPEADRTTLIRRVCFDLTGLPPTVAEIDAFLQDRAPNAYERVVERYLGSPQYGERWGKYWLDAAGYADSNGYFNADTDRPLAWKYRDYVVRSFNADKPYDQFVREQLAGDELAGYRPDGDVPLSMIEGLVATHFLRNAPDGTGESDGNPDEVRTDRFTVLEGNVQNMMNCLLGLTVQCARCHDHKFEPISQKEYYSIQALLFPVYNPNRWSKPNERMVQVGTRSELAAHQRLNDQIDRQIRAAQSGLAAFAEPLREQFLDQRLRDLDAAERDAILGALHTKKEKRTAAQIDLLKRHAKRVEITDDMLAARFPEYGRLREQVKQTIGQREKDRPRTAEKIAAYVETDPKPPAHHVLKRGLHGNPGEEVRPGALEVLSTPKNRFQVEPPSAARVSTGRRTAFARWVTSPENPLLARVMVNRIWQLHFGSGIVTTADNLGVSGAKPSHPELLDFLAAELVRSGWSVKAVQRLILNSAVYRQRSEPRDRLDAIDPDNRLLARFPLRRLDAEAVRDAMLHVAGELDTRAGGPYVPSKRTAEGSVEVAENTDGAHRRSIYLQQRRTQVVTFLQLFDAPSIVTTCGKRSPSTVPLQSFVLLNSAFARSRGKAFAARLGREAGDDAARRLDLAFRLACGRPPLREERSLCEAFLAKQSTVYAEKKDAGPRAWADLCQMLLASNAFLYVE
jgi:hypothetical protein